MRDTRTKRQYEGFTCACLDTWSCCGVVHRRLETAERHTRELMEETDGAPTIIRATRIQGVILADGSHGSSPLRGRFKPGENYTAIEWEPVVDEMSRHVRFHAIAESRRWPIREGGRETAAWIGDVYLQQGEELYKYVNGLRFSTGKLDPEGGDEWKWRFSRAPRVPDDIKREHIHASFVRYLNSLKALAFEAR